MEKKTIKEAYFLGVLGPNSWKATQNQLFLANSLHFTHAWTITKGDMISAS